MYYKITEANDYKGYAIMQNTFNYEQTLKRVEVYFFERP